MQRIIEHICDSDIHCHNTGKTSATKYYIVEDGEIWDCVTTHKILKANGAEIHSASTVTVATRRK